MDTSHDYSLDTENQQLARDLRVHSNLLTDGVFYSPRLAQMARDAAVSTDYSLYSSALERALRGTPKVKQWLRSLVWGMRYRAGHEALAASLRKPDAVHWHVLTRACIERARSLEDARQSRAGVVTFTGHREYACAVSRVISAYEVTIRDAVTDVSYTVRFPMRTRAQRDFVEHGSLCDLALIAWERRTGLQARGYTAEARDLGDDCALIGAFAGEIRFSLDD